MQHETAMNILKRQRNPVETLISLLARGARISYDEAASLSMVDFVAAVDLLYALFEAGESRLLADLLKIMPANPRAAH